MGKKEFISLFCFLILMSFGAKAGSIESGFSALQQFNYFEAKKQFEKSLKKYPSAASYGLAVIYSRNDNPFSQLDSAYSKINYAEKNYGATSDKIKNKLKVFHFDYQAIDSLRAKISFQFYQLVVQNPSERGFDEFQQKHPWSQYKFNAIHKRDSIALIAAYASNNSAGFDNFLKKYPESEYRQEAFNEYNRLQYKEETVPNNVASYLSFMKLFPSNTYIGDAQDQIYNLTTKPNKVADYKAFIETYPNNRNVDQAWRTLYQLYMSDYSTERFDKFLAEFPTYPFKEELEKDRNLSQQTLIPYKDNGSFGWMDLNGKIVIPAQYGTVGFFKEGLAWAERNGKYGFVNKANEVMIPFKFTSANDFDKGRAIVELDTLFGIVDRSGAFIIPAKFKDIGQYAEGLIYAVEDSLYGFFDGFGFPRIPAQFDEAFSFSNGMAKVNYKGYEAYIDEYGAYVIRPLFTEINIYTDSLIVAEDGDYFKLAYYSGKVLDNLMPIDDIGVLKNNRCIFFYDGMVGYLNEKGKVVVQPTYDEFTNAKTDGEFNGNYAKVSKKEKFGIIDRDGKVVVPISYPVLGKVGTLVAFEKGGKWGFIDLSNRVVIQPSYEYAESFASGLGIVQMLTLRGAINSKGQVVIPLEHTTIKQLDEAHFLVSLGAKYGIYTNKGELVVPLEYGNIRKVQDDFYILSKGQEMHYFYVPENRVIKPNLEE